MPKDVQMSIKMEPALREQFMAAAARRHRPAAQVIRELMRFYIEQQEIPNDLTAETIRKVQQVRTCSMPRMRRTCFSNWAFDALGHLYRPV